MIRFRPLLLMTAASLVALVVLTALGRWQWERYELALARADEPLPPCTIVEYEPLSDGLQFVYGVRPDTHEAGWRVFAPVQDGASVIFVDADFIPYDKDLDASEVRFPAALGAGAPVTGVSVEPQPPALFAVAPDLVRRRWFSVDLAAMGRRAGLQDVDTARYCAAAYRAADGRAVPNPFPGADALPPARHLGYALTWYGLAIVLLGVYFAYHGSVGRLAFVPPRAPED